MIKENFENWQVGMLVFLKKNNHPMTVDKFLMDDFCEDRFCDRLECSWYDEKSNKQSAIFDYDEVSISDIN